MQACLSSSSPVGQSIKPSHRTWSSMQWYLPILSAVGQANLSIPSSDTGHSVNRMAKILPQSVGVELTLCLDITYRYYAYKRWRYPISPAKSEKSHVRGIARGKMQEKLVSSFWRKNVTYELSYEIYIISVIVFVTSSMSVFPASASDIFSLCRVYRNKHSYESV